MRQRNLDSGGGRRRLGRTTMCDVLDLELGNEDLDNSDNLDDLDGTSSDCSTANTSSSSS